MVLSSDLADFLIIWAPILAYFKSLQQRRTMHLVLVLFVSDEKATESKDWKIWVQPLKEKAPSEIMQDANWLLFSVNFSWASICLAQIFFCSRKDRKAKYEF